MSLKWTIPGLDEPLRDGLVFISDMPTRKIRFTNDEGRPKDGPQPPTPSPARTPRRTPDTP